MNSRLNPGKGAVAGAPKNIYSLTPIFSQQRISDIHKSFGEADYIKKIGNIWRSFWYVGIIILLSALNKNGNDALDGITKKKRIRRKGRTPLILSKDKSKTFIPQLPWQSIHGKGTFY